MVLKKNMIKKLILILIFLFVSFGKAGEIILKLVVKLISMDILLMIIAHIMDNINIYFTFIIKVNLLTK